MKSVTRLNLYAFLVAGRKARPNEKAIKVDTKLVDAFFTDVVTTEQENKIAVAEKDADIVALHRQLAEAKAKIPTEPAE